MFVDIESNQEKMYALQVDEDKFVLLETQDGLIWDTTYFYLGLDEDPPYIFNPKEIEILNNKIVIWGFSTSFFIFEIDLLDLTSNLISLPDEERVNHLQVINENTSIAIGNTKTYFTKDNWKTFETQNRNDPYFQVSDMIQTNDSLFYSLTVEDNTYFRSLLVNDDELRWEKVFNTNQTRFADIEKLSDSIFICAGFRRNGIGDQSSDIIYRSSNSGKDWISVLDRDTYPIFGLAEIKFNDSLNGIATGSLGKAYYSRNSGMEWRHLNLKDSWVDLVSDSDLPSINSCWHKNQLYLATTRGYIYKVKNIQNYFDLDTDIFDKSELINPSNESLINSNSVTFSWSNNPKTDFYKLVYTNLNDNSSNTIQTEDTSIVINTLEYFREYKWEVVSYKDNDIKTSNSFIFSTEYNFQTPIITSNCDTLIDSEQVVLSWNTVDPSIELVISDNLDFNDILYSSTFNSTSTSFNFFEKGSLYFWRARSFIEDNYSEWSETCNFITKLDSPEFIYPFCDATLVKVDTIFSWDEVQNAEEYNLELTEVETNIKINFSSKINTYAIPNLDFNTSYKLNINAVNEYSTSDKTECIFDTEILISVQEAKFKPYKLINNTVKINESLNNSKVYMVDLSGKYYNFNQKLEIKNLRNGFYSLFIEGTVYKIIILN